VRLPEFCLEWAAQNSSNGDPSSAHRDHMPKHLAEKILTSRIALEGERGSLGPVEARSE